MNLKELTKEYDYCPYIDFVPSRPNNLMPQCKLDTTKIISKELCKGCKDNSACSSYCVEKVVRKWDNGKPVYETVHRCNGTKDRDYCNCKGNKLNCDFY